MSGPAQIRYAVTSDGVHIVYATVGEGFPLVMVPGWISYLPDWLEEAPDLAGIRHVLYDKRGTGLSDRALSDYSIEARVRDLEAVADALSLERFILAGFSDGAPIAMAYAATHAERVAGLILYGGFAVGEGVDPAVHGAVEALTRAAWGMASLALTSLFAPGCTHEEAEKVAQNQVKGATAEDAARLWQACYAIDVRTHLSSLRCPTLIVHARGDRIVPFERARELTAAIENARLLPVESERHMPGPEEVAQITPGWVAFVDETILRECGAPPISGGVSPAVAGGLSAREIDVLRLLAQGKSNRQVADALTVSESTVATHVRHILEKTGSTNRTAATLYAVRNGLA
jgi:pimeloyl-ACP methyl ester carboxylesterase/DNA-binding CsgD family transcriptional regulator